MTTVAILQNQFRLSGRTRVVYEFIDLLNELGIEPDVLTFTPPDVGREVGDFLGYKNLRFGYKQIAPIPFSRGWLWQILLINRLTWKMQENYDWILNSNNTLHGLNPTINYLHYVYYPIAINPIELEQFQEYRQSLPRYLYGLVLGTLLAVSGQVEAKNIYAISEFSRDAVVRTYPESAQTIKIIYPPSVYEPVKSNPERVLRCMSTGSITADKRQLDQLEIAKRLPEIEFWIAGAVKSQKYYRKCQEFIEREGLNNVRLIPDMPYAQLQAALHESRYFLHTKHDEHFGISTVEAIAAGCIAVTHDSGGQREIVPVDDLRFQSIDEAVQIFKNLQSHNVEPLVAQQRILQNHVQRFSREVFRDGMREAIGALD
jgi:glycosyltransferase involved in cell wall biosynthesis